MSFYTLYFISYFAMLFGVGIYHLKKIKTPEEYLIAGHSMSFWPMVGTIVSTWCGASVFIGSVGMGRSMGLSGYFKFTFPAGIISILFVLIFAVALRRQNLVTLSELFIRRYGESAGIIPTLLSVFGYAVPTVAMQIAGMCTIWSVSFGWEHNTCLLVSFLLLVSFTILGGLPATIITDSIQALIIIAGLFILLFACLGNAGGVSEILANTPDMYFSPLGEFGLGDVLLYALSVGPFYIVWQSTWQRIFACKDESTAKKSGLLGFGIATVVSVMPFLIGIAARGIVPGDLEDDMIFSYITGNLLSPALGGLIYVALLSALVTTGDSIILQGSSSLTRDVYQRYINRKADDRKIMIVSRVTVILIAVISYIVAMRITNIIAIYKWALRLSGTTLVIPFIASMFWKRSTKKGVIWSMAASAVVTTVWPYIEAVSSLDCVIAGFATSALVLIIVSLVTAHSADEDVKALYHETVSNQ